MFLSLRTKVDSLVRKPDQTVNKGISPKAAMPPWNENKISRSTIVTRHPGKFYFSIVNTLAEKSNDYSQLSALSVSLGQENPIEISNFLFLSK